MRRVFCYLLMALLASCASRDATLPLAQEDLKVATTEHIHVATLRAASDNKDTVYSGERSDSLNFAEIKVSIPKNREPGTIVYPRADAFVDRQFASVGHTTNKSDKQFIDDINRQLMNNPKDGRTIFLFVHGYNTNFAAGIFRQAQMFHDFQFKGVPVSFSWASAGKTPLYLYDRDSAQLARTGLRRTLKLLAQTKADGISLVAHSMGSFVTMETLRDMGIRGEKSTIRRIESLVLASPDIDLRVFREQLSEINPLPQPFVIFVSNKDRALQASQRLRGGQARLGFGTNVEELSTLGITVVDLSNVNDGQDATNHSTFATSKTLFKMAKDGAFSREALLGAQKKDNALKPIGDGIGAVTDLAAAIIYLPAKIVGVR